MARHAVLGGFETTRRDTNAHIGWRDVATNVLQQRTALRGSLLQWRR